MNGCPNMMVIQMVRGSFQLISNIQKIVFLKIITGFTAYEKVCFHFNCPNEVFQEALERFAKLFTEEAILQVCQNGETLKREIRRINSELDSSNINAREIYLLKSLINPDHPWARNTMGNLETLETYPAKNDIDVSQRLIEFFKEHYLPSRAILVVVCPVADFSTLESWVLPFSSSLSRSKSSEVDEKRTFPDFSMKQNKITTICLYRGNSAAMKPRRVGDDLETLSLYWGLTLDYTGIEQIDRNVVSAPQIGFVLSQILGRRGPGSLYSLLRKRQWNPEGSKGVPRVGFPVDVSGFQLLKLELSLTQEGFASRSAVIAAIYDSINALQASSMLVAPYQIRRELIAEYMTVAQLYGYTLAPRPPDAVELAFDAQLYGVDGPKGVGTPGWHRFPSPEDNGGVMSIQRCLKDILLMMSDPSNAIVIATASQDSILASKQNLFDGSLPPMSPASWNISPVTGARYYFDDMFRLTGRVNEWLVARLMEDELQPPVLNPLIPPMLRPPRIPDKTFAVSDRNPYFLLDNPQLEERKRGMNSWKDVIRRSSISTEGKKMGNASDPLKSAILKDYWAVLSTNLQEDKKTSLVPLPRAPPEPSCRCVFVLQLLSTRPARANSRSAAHAELWRVGFLYFLVFRCSPTRFYLTVCKKISLEAALSDLAELGAPAGLAYEISFNKYGMRICFLGLSQNVPSYARRISRRVVEHQTKLLESGESFPLPIVEASIRSATRSTNMSPRRKKQIIGLLRDASPIDSAVEGIAFFKSCRGGVCFSQGKNMNGYFPNFLSLLPNTNDPLTGDLLPKETIALMSDLKEIFRKGKGSHVISVLLKVHFLIYHLPLILVTGSNIRPTIFVPALEDITYRPNFVPRSASSCTVSGSSLISDACGRVPR